MSRPESDALTYWHNWRLEHDAEFREAEAARERRRQEREERRATEAAARNEAALLRREFEARLAALEAQHYELVEQVAQITRATTQAIDGLCDTRDEIDREFRAAVTKYDATMVKLVERKEQERKRTHQFARERIAELTGDLPKPSTTTSDKLN
jgi:hypothetical protein